MKYQTVIGVVLIMAALLGCAYYFTRSEEKVFLQINAANEPELGLPVYAQFVVTQSLEVSEIFEAAALVVPMYIPVQNQDFMIFLYRNDAKVEEWELPSDIEGVQEVQLPLNNRLLDGNLEVVFDGSRISHDEKEVAPRLFVESLDLAYPHGNYRIADNQKEGDVGMTFVEHSSRWSLFLESWENEPTGLVAQGFFAAAGLLLLGYLPVVIFPRRLRDISTN